jgi:ribonuclease P protein component
MTEGRKPSGQRSSESLSYSHRLHQRSDFLRFFEGSTVARLKDCIIFRVPNSAGHFRLGLTFKIRCQSVERNALRRRIREAFRRLGPGLGSYDYNVVIRSWNPPMKAFARGLYGSILDELRSERFSPAKEKSKFGPGSGK